MSLVAWIILGFISGYLARKLVNKTGEGFLLDIGLGIVGAIIAGWLFNTFGMPSPGVDLYGSLVAIVGAVAMLVAYHAVFRRAPKEPVPPKGPVTP
jgi:uncharacterized membrane protein YeaQ/YmgE (transglycosylase-associated protein family)